MKKMRITLQGKQLEVMALPPTGHTVVLGTAGSGKTTVALQRARYLANLPNKPKVLLVTFNNALVQYINSLGDTDYSNLVVESYHKFARGYLNSRGKMPRNGGILSSDQKHRYIEAALEACLEANPNESTLKRPTEFFYDEICFIQQFGFINFEEYERAERVGRSSAFLARGNRKWIQLVYTKYIELRDNNGFMYDWDDIAAYTYSELLNDSSERLYTHIIVDEGQDFSPMMIKSLVNAARSYGSFTFFGDVAQQIYGHRLSWRDSGIQTNKIWRFEYNYRNPKKIVDFAQDITRFSCWEPDDDMVSTIPTVAEGPKPALLDFSDDLTQLSWLVSRALKDCTNASVVVICRSYEEREIVTSWFTQNHVRFLLIDKDTPGFCDPKTIYISTFHSVKGLEFDYVFIPFLDKDRFPNPKAVAAAVTQEDAYIDEIKLLYVAATRSKYGLYMSFSGEVSPLFPTASSNYDYITGDDLV